MNLPTPSQGRGGDVCCRGGGVERRNAEYLYKLKHLARCPEEMGKPVEAGCRRIGLSYTEKGGNVKGGWVTDPPVPLSKF